MSLLMIQRIALSGVQFRAPVRMQTAQQNHTRSIQLPILFGLERKMLTLDRREFATAKDKDKEKERREKQKQKEKEQKQKEKEKELKLKEKEKAQKQKEKDREAKAKAKEKEKQQKEKEREKKKLQLAKEKEQKDKEKEKKRSKKDPNKPKRSSSAFTLFVKDNYNSASSADKKASQVLKDLAGRWKGLSDADKRPYMARAEEEKGKYNTALAKYKSSLPVKPKREASPYIKFVKENIKALQERNSGTKVTELMKQLGQQWKKMPDSEKQKYGVAKRQ